MKAEMKQKKPKTSASRDIEIKIKISRKVAIIFGVSVLACACLVAILSFTSSSSAPKDEELKPRTLEELLALSDEDLGRVNIARMNLLCAVGLPHAENMDVERYLATLDKWADIIKTEEKKHRPAFERNPARFDNSLSKFKAIYLVLTIQEDLQCGYNMELVNSGVMQDVRSLRFFEDSRDLFLHGMVEQRKGSCSSLPVLAVALGRRCGYPLYLVPAKGHLFFRWDDGKESFNIESAGRGADIFPDNRYRSWPHPFTEEERINEKFLQSLTPVETLSLFMRMRGSCLHANDRFEEAEKANIVALRGFPHSQQLRGHIVNIRMRRK